MDRTHIERLTIDEIRLLDRFRKASEEGKANIELTAKAITVTHQNAGLNRKVSRRISDLKVVANGD